MTRFWYTLKNLHPPYTIEPTSVPNQTIDASLFYTKHEWLNDVKDFLRVG